MTGEDIVNSLNRQSQSPGHVLELRENPVEGTAQIIEPYETGSASRHGRSKLWITTLTLLGAPVALWLSGLLPASAVNTGDTGIDYLVAKATGLGPILWGEIATTGLAIIILAKRARHESPSHATDEAQESG